MPTYDFKCESCDNSWEVTKRMVDPNPSQCPDCSSEEIKQVIGAGNFNLKGTGWYETDFKWDGSPVKKFKGEQI